MTAAELAIPVITVTVIIWGLYRRVDIFGEFSAGAREGLKTCAELLPTLVALITAVGMFRASGAEDMILSLTGGLMTKLGFPPECLSLALIRPISGSGALAVYEALLEKCGPDSFAGRTASVILGSTETTFYTIAVYYGAVGIKRTRHTLAASLTGDITGFIISVLTVNLFFGRL